jgi:short-subunit dehydrogenase
MGTALITGASAGIGWSYAEELARRGYDLILVARSAERLEELASRSRAAHGVSVTTLAEDLSVEGGAQRVIDKVDAAGLQVDLLVNNAGFGSVGGFKDLPLERELAMIRLNIGALVALTGLVLPAMLSRGRGEIINVSSVVASHPSPGFAVYAATKAFVTSFSTALAVELSETGVYVQALHPGSTATNFQRVAGSTKSTAGTTGQTAAEVVAESLRGLDARRPMVVSGRVNRVVFPVLGALPIRVSARLSGRLLSRSGSGAALEETALTADQLTD